MGAGLDDLVDEADPVRLLGADRAAGEDHLQGTPHADDAGQTLGAAVDQGHAPAALEEPEGRVAGGDPQVAPERQLDPSGQAPALDRGDRRLRGGEAGRAHRAVGMGDVEVHRLQVGPGAEGLAAGAGEDEHAGVLVGLEVAPGRGGRARRWRRRRRCAARAGRSSAARRRRRARSEARRSSHSSRAWLARGETDMDARSLRAHRRNPVRAGAGGLVDGVIRASRRRPAPGCAPARGAEGRCSATVTKLWSRSDASAAAGKRARKNDRG